MSEAGRDVPGGPAGIVPGAILDVRPLEAFARGHLRGAGHIPRGEFEQRRTELPPREAPVVVVSDDPAEAAAAAGDLERLGYARVHWLELPLAAIRDGLGDQGPPARLWRPAPFLEEVLPALPPGRAIDVASGSGRDAVFLALHGWEVEAWDHDPEALGRARALAARHGVTIATVVANLERREPPIPAGAYDLVVCFRFLHRPLFPDLEAALRPGGALVYETYRLGQARFGRPRQKRFLLRDGELASGFPGLEVERYEELDPEEGPITARLLGRKR